MTYDEWKLRTPEDELYRGRYRHPSLCPHCGEDYEQTVDGDCVCCGEPLDGGPDPDDARDDMQDREMDR